MEDCIFCKIAKKEIASKLVYEDDNVVAFEDIDPKAPVHVLIIPRQHISSLLDIDENNMYIINAIIKAVNHITKELGIDKSGFRVVNNCGKYGGQTVKHLHFHLLGGRQMNWPPG